MQYFVTRNEDDALEGSIRYPFIYGTGDVEIIIATDLDVSLSECLVFFNSASSLKITSTKKCILRNYGIIAKDLDSSEISGLTFYNFKGDGIQHYATPKFSVKHCTFIGHVSETDEAISSVKGSGSSRGEISWNLFSNVNKGILCGTGDAGDEALDVSQKVYIHHNWFYNFERRAPYCRYGNYFIYNNIFENWHYKDVQTFCIWSEYNANTYVLDNTFKQGSYNIWDGFPKRQCSWFTKRPWCMNQGVKCIMGGKSYLHNNQKNQSWIKLEGENFTPSIELPEYESYSLEMATCVQANAGSGIQN